GIELMHTAHRRLEQLVQVRTLGPECIEFRDRLLNGHPPLRLSCPVVSRRLGSPRTDRQGYRPTGPGASPDSPERRWHSSRSTPPKLFGCRNATCVPSAPGRGTSSI